MSCGSKEEALKNSELLLDVKFPVESSQEVNSLKREINEYVVSIDGREVGRIPSKDQISQLFQGLPQDEILTVTIEAIDNADNITWQGTHEIDFTVSKPKDFWMEKRR